MNRKTILFLIGGAIILVAVATFIGMRLLNAGAPTGNGLAQSLAGSGKNSKPGMSYAVTPAAEVPQQRADAVGQVTDIKDNSIFIVPQDKNLTVPQAQEVLVVEETQIFRDTTGDHALPPDGVNSVQETVERSTLAQMARSDLLEVWGEQRGSRLIASVIVMHGIQTTK
jgi:hypothetical protein